MSPTPHRSPRSEDDRLAPLLSHSRAQVRLTTLHNHSTATVDSKLSIVTDSSGVQSQIGTRWQEDLPTTINSGFGNLGTPWGMNRKPVREGRERGVGRKPVPETLLRALRLRSVTEEEKEQERTRELEEQVEDYRRMLRRIEKQRNTLEKSQQKLELEVTRFINISSLKQFAERSNSLGDLATTIRELKKELDDYETTVRTNEEQAAAQELYDERFDMFIDDTKRMKVLVNSMGKRLNRHLRSPPDLMPEQKTSKMVSTETQGEQEGTTFTPELSLPNSSLNRLETFRSDDTAPDTLHGEVGELLPAEKPPDLAKTYEDNTALEDTIRKKITDIAEETKSLMARLVHLIPEVMAHVSELEEPNKHSRRQAIHARLISIESRSNNLRNKLMMKTPELEAGRLTRLYFEDLVMVAPNVEALCRAVSGLLRALSPKRDQKTKENQPPKCKEAEGTGVVHQTCASDKDTDDDQSTATLAEYDFPCEKSTNEASSPPSLSASSITLVDAVTKDDPTHVLSTKSSLRKLLLVDIVAEQGSEPTQSITSTLQSLFDQSDRCQALQKVLIPDVAVLEYCTRSWSFSRVMQVKGLSQTLEELLQNVTKLQCDLKEAEGYEEEDGGDLITSIRHHSHVAKEMKGEVSAMIRSLLYSEHCEQKRLESTEKKD